MSVDRVIEKLAKWRVVFAGWQLGTRPKGDPECDAVRDHREVTILLRAEVNALTAILIEKGIMTEGQFSGQVGFEAQFLDRMYEQRFPGISTTDDGVTLTMPEAALTMEGWLP